MKKRKHNSTPKRKRLNRKQRISEAENWLKTYKGKNVVRGYSNWFGVDLLCAITELRAAGEDISTEYEEKVKQSQKQRINQKRLIKEYFQAKEGIVNEWDAEFLFIAGYTSNGVPYGISKGELFPGDEAHNS